LHTAYGSSTRDQRHRYLRFEGLQYTDADIADFETRLGKICRREVHRAHIFDFGGLTDLMAEGLSDRMLMEHRDAQGQGISSAGDFLGTTPPYTSIRDPMLRLCHRLIACSIAGMSQTPKNVTVTDLFYLRGMDVGSVNIPYLLARAKLVRLQICEELDDAWAWVASRPDRKQVVATGTAKAAEDAPVVDEGAPAVPTPVQAPQPPPLMVGPAKTMTQRLGRLEEDVHSLRGALGEQREVLDSMARDISRFSTWTVIGLSRMMDQAGVRYTSYSDYHIRM
ncbi:hypothetical protein Tco_1421775, partial [Tanacetum coccineum]